MENKKDIGKLFKDNLSQLNYSPSDMVWDKIETDLKKDKKKRRFFFWFFFSFLLIIGTTCYSYYHLNSIQKEKKVKNIQNNFNSKATNKNSNSNSSDKIINSNSNPNEKTDKATRNNSSVEKNNSTNKSTFKEDKTKTSKKSNVLFSIEKANKSQKHLASQKNKNEKIKNTKSSKNKITQLVFNDDYLKIKNYKKKNSHKKRAKIKKNKTNYHTENRSLTTNHSSNSYSRNDSKDENSPHSNSNSPILDSLCTDENCIIVEEKKTKKPEKKKLPVSEKDSIIKPKSKVFIVSPFAGFNNLYKIGSENKYGNTEIIENPTKYGNLFGLKVKWMFTEKTGIQSGISVNTYYYNTTIKKTNGTLETKSIKLNQEPNALNSLFSSSEKVTFQQHLRYIEIPFEAYHYFNTNKLSHATSFGLSFYFPLKNEMYAYSENVNKINIGKSQSYLKQGYGLNLNYYLNYNLNNKIQIFISPAAQFQFLGNLDYEQPTSYSISISSGINYKL